MDRPTARQTDQPPVDFSIPHKNSFIGGIIRRLECKTCTNVPTINIKMFYSKIVDEHQKISLGSAQNRVVRRFKTLLLWLPT